MTQAKECTIDQITRVLSKLESKLNEIEIPPKSEKATSTVAQPSEKTAEEKKPSSWWGRCREKFRKNSKAQKNYEASESGGSSKGKKRNIGDDEAKADLVIEKLQSDIRQMKSAFENLSNFQSVMTLELGFPSNKLNAMLEKKESIRSRPDDLKIIRNKIFDLKCQIPSLLYKQSSRALSTTDSQTAEENVDETGSDMYLRGLHASKDLKHSSAFEEVVDKFEGLDFTKKLCLLSFAVFPENKEVKRTMLMYWWIGEEFISCDHNSENTVTEILDEFSRKRLLEPVEDEKKLKPNSYKMEPYVHSAVIYLAKQVNQFDLYNDKGKLFMKPQRQKVCLVKGSSLQQEAKTSKMEPKLAKTVFNSSERYPDFTFKWFPQMEALKVLYLGRWERTAKRHIEVESTENLKHMKDLKNLRLASFQGISRIQELEKSICALPKLVILDLRACYNLETLPEDIGKLENLIYLDVSECYMLDSMPKGIADLLKLQVLKGFVISQNDDERKCAVRHLKSLKKLSITVNKKRFEVENLMESLKDLENLESLKIAWGAREEEGKGGDKKDLKEQEDDQVHKTSEEKKEKVSLEQGNKQEEVKAESFKSDKVVEGENKTSRSGESTGMIQNKVVEEGDGDKGKVDQEEGKNKDEVKAKSLNPEKVVEGDEKTNPLQESKETVQSKPDDEKEKSKVQEKGDGEKNRDDLRKLDGREEKTPKSDKKTKFGKNVSFSEEPLIQKKPDDLKRDDVMTKESHETASPSRTEKTDPKKSRFSQVKQLMRKVNETKRWDNPAPHTAKLPSSLKKLELECLPDEKPPRWLNPDDLSNLEKLSIRGGYLSRINHKSPIAENNWNVQILRLKYLHEFKAEWKELQALFPKMVLLEKYQCPKVSFCPTDGNGVWKSSDMPK